MPVSVKDIVSLALSDPKADKLPEGVNVPTR
jgi:hypothetical protein